MSHEVKNPGAAHGSFVQYMIGFGMSLFLTVVPFALVMVGETGPFVVSTIAMLAFAQIFVQVVFFLHLNGSEEQRWDTIAFVYTILVMAFFLVGSIWVMNTLHHYMAL